jgi:hypothetical protein
MTTVWFDLRSSNPTSAVTFGGIKTAIERVAATTIANRDSPGSAYARQCKEKAGREKS